LRFYINVVIEGSVKSAADKNSCQKSSDKSEGVVNRLHSLKKSKHHTRTYPVPWHVGTYPIFMNFVLMLATIHLNLSLKDMKKQVHCMLIWVAT